jgi:hypothetical protein
VNDLVAIISEQFADAQREMDAEKTSLESYLTERLSSDDQILGRLPGLVSQIVTEPEPSEDEKSVEQWCKAIVAYRTAEAKAKVDVVYLNSVANYSPGDLPDAGSEEEMKERKIALQNELEELHTEIAAVAEMVVEHELRKPLTEGKERNERERLQARSAWSNYVGFLVIFSLSDY